LNVNIASHKEIKQNENYIRPKHHRGKEARGVDDGGINIKYKNAVYKTVYDTKGQSLLPISLNGVPEIVPNENRLAGGYISQYVRSTYVYQTEGEEPERADTVKYIRYKRWGESLILEALKTKKNHFVGRYSVGCNKSRNVLIEVREGNEIRRLEISRKIANEEYEREISEYHKHIDRNQFVEIILVRTEKPFQVRRSIGRRFAYTLTVGLAA
jgi:hypothetical protein